jgi:dTDP-glucose 4,6-dehydratase
LNYLLTIHLEHRLLTMRVLVTGAAGFLGSHLTTACWARAIPLSAWTTSPPAIGKHRAPGHEPRFHFEERDICKPFDVGPVDYVFNFASPASPPEYLRLAIETLRVGSVGVENTLEIAARMAPAICTPPPRSATATRWSIRSARVTGAM